MRFLTGATDGIGKALALRWHARGRRAFLHGRRDPATFDEAELELFPAERYVRGDLARDDGAERVAAELSRRCRGDDASTARLPLDMLVLNAGTGFVGPLEEQDASSIDELIRVNLLAPMRLTQLLLPALRHARGRVVYVSSVVTPLPTPEFAVYTATKSAAEGFFRSLRVEERGAVDVQVLRPGAVRTGMHAKSGADLEAIGWSGFPAAADVARELDAHLESSAHWRTVGWRNRALFGVARAFPGILDRAVARRSR